MLKRNVVVFMVLAMTVVGCGILDSGTCKNGNNEVSKVETSSDRLTLTLSDTVYGPAVVTISVRLDGDFINLSVFTVESEEKGKEFTVYGSVLLSVFSTSPSDYRATVVCSN